MERWKNLTQNFGSKLCRAWLGKFSFPNLPQVILHSVVDAIPLTSRSQKWICEEHWLKEGNTWYNEKILTSIAQSLVNSHRFYIGIAHLVNMVFYQEQIGVDNFILEESNQIGKMKEKPNSRRLDLKIPWWNWC